MKSTYKSFGCLVQARPDVASYDLRSQPSQEQSCLNPRVAGPKIAPRWPAVRKHEVAYESGKTGATPGEVRQAVKDAGNSRKKVEEKLSQK